MNAALERIEPVLNLALALADRSEWQRAHEALRSCLEFAELHRAAQYAEYNIASQLESLLRAACLTNENRGVSGTVLTGDAAQIATIARTVLSTAILESDAELQIDALYLDGVPTWQLKIEGPGRFSDRLEFGHDLSVAPEAAEAIWTSATRGGRIDRRAGEIDLRLKGVRAVLDTPLGCDGIIQSLRDAERSSRVLSAAETVTNETSQLRKALADILKQFDEQDDQPNPCDLQALTREAFLPADPQFSVRFDIVFNSEVPAQLLRRNRILRFFTVIQSMARAAMGRGGNVRVEFDYALPQRAVTLFVNGEGQMDLARAEQYLPALQRALDIHRGAMEADFAANGFTLLVTVPDAIALTLDEWLPGWDTFAPRSIQMLRLLKSGGPVPPEELILNGVLEDELERRLLPRLGVAPAATLIHDLEPRKPELSTSSSQRVEKIVSQVKRGKPKKEICAPPYAAEIIWMFGIDQRHAAAIGINDFDTLQTTELAKTLAATPLNLLAALRLLPLVLKRQA